MKKIKHTLYKASKRISTIMLLSIIIGVLPARAQYDFVAPVPNSSTNISPFSVADEILLNCDARDVSVDGTGLSGTVMAAITWSGIFTSGFPHAGFYVGIDGVTTTPALVTLPTGAMRPDIAIGFDGSDYRIAVVYELDTDVYLDSYDLSFTSAGANASCGTPVTIQLNTPGKRSGNPHIDVHRYNGSNGGFIYYAAVWEEVTTAPNYDVKLQFGDIFDLVGCTPTAIGVAFNLPFGSTPDVACVNDVSLTGGVDRAYVTYSANEEHVYVQEVQFFGLGSSPCSFGLIIPGGPDVLPYLGNVPPSPGQMHAFWGPRIDAPTGFDFSTPPPTTAVKYVVAANYGTNHSTFFGMLQFDQVYYARLHNSTYASNLLSYTTAGYSFSGSPFPGYLNVYPAVAASGDPTAGSYPGYVGAQRINIGFTSTEEDPSTSTTGQGGTFVYSLEWNGNEVKNTVPSPPETYMWRVSNLPTNPWYGVNNNWFPRVALANCANTGNDLLTAYWGGNGEPIEYKLAGNGGSPAYKNAGNEPKAKAPLQGSITKDINKDGQLTIAKGNLSFKQNALTKSQETAYKLYPNPAGDKLHILGAKDADYIIKDMAGRMISGGRADGRKAINTSALAPGIYMMSVSENGKTQNLKFVKE